MGYWSLVQEDTSKCYLSGNVGWLEWHHVFGGAFKKISEENGFMVRLNHHFHNEPPCKQNFGMGSAHFNKEVREKLQRDCQIAFEKHHTREEFIKLIGRNYL